MFLFVKRKVLNFFSNDIIVLSYSCLILGHSPLNCSVLPLTMYDITYMLLMISLLTVADTQHQFNARESDWGFTSFMPLGELYDPSRGYLVNDTCVVEADVAVRRVVDYWSHDSKKETGYVGLKNQGATCYMNSLLQTLYHIPYFRKVCDLFITYHIDMIIKEAQYIVYYCRLCIICQQLKMICHQEAFLWLCRVCFISSSTVIQV